MATQSSNRNRSFVWEDEPAAETRTRRAQTIAPAPLRGLPGMPADWDEADEDAPRRKAAAKPWWKPAGRLGWAAWGVSMLVVIGALGYAGHVAKSFLERDGRFRITGSDHIQATGLTEVTRPELLSVFGADMGRNIFFVPLADRRHALEQIPWVDQATVMRILPDQIRVDIVERKPVAFVRHGQQIGLVDANGVLLDMSAASMAKHHYSFPVLTGLDAGDSLAARRARVDLYEKLIGELDANGQHASSQISEIDLTDPEDARVLMPEQGSDILAHFGNDHFLERYQRYTANIGEWRNQYPHLAAVDLRYDQQVVLQMQAGSAASDATLTPADMKADLASPMPEAKPQPAAQPATHAATSAAKPAALKPATSGKPSAGKPVTAAKPGAATHGAKPASKSKARAKHPAAKPHKKAAAKPHHAATRKAAR